MSGINRLPRVPLPKRRKPLARSTKPIKRSLIKRRPRRKKPDEDPKYLEWIRTLPCVACSFCDYREGVGEGDAGARMTDFALGLWRRHLQGVQYRESRVTEAAHIGLSTSRRGLAQKFPDREAAPLCEYHHRIGRRAIHRIGPDPFFADYSISRDGLLRWLNALYDRGRA